MYPRRKQIKVSGIAAVPLFVLFGIAWLIAFATAIAARLAVPALVVVVILVLVGAIPSPF